jgi:hypothetical protein
MRSGDGTSDGKWTSVTELHYFKGNRSLFRSCIIAIIARSWGNRPSQPAKIPQILLSEQSDVRLECQRLTLERPAVSCENLALVTAVGLFHRPLCGFRGDCRTYPYEEWT